MKTQTETPKRKERKPEPEPMATRVALHPFLAGMSRTQLALLTDCAMAAHFKTGETILRKGEFANRCYLIETGKVAVESGGNFSEPLVIEMIGAGDLLGWSWMFPPYAWQFTARAIEPTTAIVFYGPILREYCEKDHSFGFELLKRISAVMVKRLQAAHKQMLSIHSRRMSLQPLICDSPFTDRDQDLSEYD